MNRIGHWETIWRLELARARIPWCMVGTAEYQMRRNSANQSKNLDPSKPGVQITLAPAVRDESKPHPSLDGTKCRCLKGSKMALRAQRSACSAPGVHLVPTPGFLPKWRWLKRSLPGPTTIEIFYPRITSSLPGVRKLFPGELSHS